MSFFFGRNKNNTSTSKTERGESSTATGNGDLLRSRIFGYSEQQYSIGAWIKVPDHLRIQDEQAFTPRLISIGPIHRSNVKLQTMERYKVEFCKCFIQQANIDLQLLEHNIRGMEDGIRSYYAETIVSSSRISRDDFVTMIAVDVMFILEYFLIESNPHLVQNNLMIADWMPPILKFDLVLLENQLPFFVFEELFQQANFGPELLLKRLSLKELAFKFFQYYNFQKKEVDYFEHFTDLVRLFYLSEQLPDRRPIGDKLFYSATQLNEVGVKFRRHTGRGFLDIRFDYGNGVLEIPCISLNNERVRLIQNIIALEQSNYVGHTYVTDFFVMLDFLIDTSNDVDLLCYKGILINYLGDSNAAASVVNSLCTNISWDYMNPDYLQICEDLNAFHMKRWHKWKATFWSQYFSNPWIAASTIAAIILLVLTAIQTVCSLRSTKW